MKRSLHRILLFCALIGLLSACQPIQPNGAQTSSIANAEIEKELIAKEQAWLDCSVTYDVEGCSALMSEDHLWVDNLGNRNTG